MNINRLLQVVKKRRRALNSAFSIALSMALSLFLCTFLVSCAGGASGGSDVAGGEPTSLCVQMPTTRSAQYELSDVESFTVTIKSSAYSDTKSCGQGERISFTNLPVGHYDVTAYGKKSDGKITAKGTASVDIEANVTKTVTIRLSRLTHCTVSFKTEAGGDIAGISSQEVNVGDKATNPGTPSIPGKTFSMWAKRISSTEISGSSFDFNTPITDDIELVAICDAIRYPITFDYNGGKIGDAESSTVNVLYGQTPTPSAEPERTGYRFLGWSTSASSPTATGTVPVTEDTTTISTYYAVWEAKTYNIAYQGVTTYGSQGASSPSSYTYGTPVTISNAVGTNCTFAGWYTDAALTTAFTGITATTTGNLTLYAKFTATVSIYKEKVSGTLTTLLNTQTVACGETATALATAPTKTGYVFDTWKTGTGTGSAFTFGTSGTTITGDCDVWATWTPSYTITYHNVNIGSGSTYKGTISATAISSYTYNATSSTTLPSPTVSDSHYEFGGWYETSDFSDTGVTAVPAGSNEDKDYYAMYKYKDPSITCSIEDFNAIDGFSRSCIEWRVTGTSPSLSAIASAIASKGIDVELDLTAGGISTAIVSGTFDSIIAHLVGISLPGGMTTISTNTFKGYNNLTSVWIPPTVNSIEVGAFDGCTSLATVDGLSGSTWHVRNGGGLNVSLPLDDAISTFKDYLIQADTYFDRLP